MSLSKNRKIVIGTILRFIIFGILVISELALNVGGFKNILKVLNLYMMISLTLYNILLFFFFDHIFRDVVQVCRNIKHK